MDIPFFRSCILCSEETDAVPIEELRQCSFCGTHSEADSFFCFDICWEPTCRTKGCQKDYHLSCWKKHISVWPPASAKRHVMVNPLPTMYVDAITHAEKDKEKQRKMHENDEVAQWFVLKSGENAPPRLCLTDRFRQLCDPGNASAGWASRVYPGFISFIGDTQMGKSTLVRAMILMGLLDSNTRTGANNVHNMQASDDISQHLAALRKILTSEAAFPVSRSGNIDDMNKPTSYGVHLYKDSTTVWSDHVTSYGTEVQRETPILFADCEGFRASATKSSAETAGLSRHGSSAQSNLSTSSTSGRKSIDLPLHRSPRLNVLPDNRSSRSSSTSGVEDVQYRSTLGYLSEHLITARSYANRGKTGLDIFYARFLYAISDVIVFVVKADGSLVHELQRLMEWALKAVGTSVNQSPYKTLVIVRNCERLHDKELYDPSNLKKKMFRDLPKLWENSPALKAFRDSHNETYNSFRNKIFSNEELFNQFFQDIKVSYIPDSYRVDQTEELYSQYRKLRAQLIEASQDGQAQRSRIWMQYNVPTLAQILGRAFEHFRVSDVPFDFYKAARNDNPNPTSISGHIANFLRHTYDLQDLPNLMESKVVASGLIAYVLRHTDTVTDPIQMFEPELEEWCEEGLDTFRKKYHQCSYRSSDGAKCSLLREIHQLEHVDPKGKSVPGSFMSSRRHQDLTRRIRRIFIAQYESLCQDKHGQMTLPPPNHRKASKLRRETLGEFSSFWRLFQSNKTCLSCLQACPDHMLQCGHSFCDDCVIEFGSPASAFEYTWKIADCILCQQVCPDPYQVFHLHPPCAGVRVLTLDGGGVRGIVELALLKAISPYLPADIKLRDYFDVIIGTSTGLATLDLTIEELTDRFFILARETFGKTHGKQLGPGWDPKAFMTKILMIMRIHDSLYPTTPLEKGLKSLFTSDRNLFSAANRTVKVAVTAVKDVEATFCFIANYNRADSASSLDFEREDNNQNEFKVWEAGLATSAAPFYFSPFRKEDAQLSYLDGGLAANLPINCALDEVKKLYTGHPHLDILLSLGTGIQQQEMRIPTVFRVGGFDRVCVNFQNSIDSQRTWDKLQRTGGLPNEVQSSVYRLNADIREPYVGLDDHTRMQEMYEDVLSKTPEMEAHILKVADSLLASLFFFAPNAPPEGRSWSDMGYIDGTIRCRLPCGSSGLQSLLDMLAKFWSRELRARDNLADESSAWAPILLPPDLIQRARSGDSWFRLPHRITNVGVSDSKVVLGVSFYRRSEDRQMGSRLVTTPQVPISGFPEAFGELRTKCTRRMYRFSEARSRVALELPA